MKRILAICAIALLLTGCENHNDFGPCVGVGEDQKDPKLSYKVSGWNVAMGVIFFEFIAPPIIVITDELYCPSGVKP
jgi:hypothetical protein